MRRLPVLHHNDFIFTRLKALAWVANKTILPTLLQADAGKALTYLAEHDYPDKPLVIDCRGIIEIDDHALETTKRALHKHQRPLVLINSNQLQPSITNDLGGYDSRFQVGNIPIIVVGPGSIDRPMAERLIAQISDTERLHITNWVGECFRRYANGMQRMASTPLLSSGVFDARALIADPVKFVWISMLMAHRLEQYLDKALENTTQDGGQLTRSFRLLAVSLRGSPLAAAVGLLTARQKNIEIVDHMGPKYKIFEESSIRTTMIEEDYIYIGDFVVGGTELRIAQAYSRSKGSKIN